MHPEIVLPCLDEAEALPYVLKRMPDDWPVIVVDNGSTDDTAAVARGHGARVVVEPRRGYGAAVHAGLEAATGEFVAFLDGDGSSTPTCCPAWPRPSRPAVPTSPSDGGCRTRSVCGPGTPARRTR